MYLYNSPHFKQKNERTIDTFLNIFQIMAAILDI